MLRQRTDVFISGAGIAGLTTALGFTALGFDVVLADPGSEPANPTEGDLRSTAYLQPARDLLDRIGVWSDLSQTSTPLEVLRVLDCSGTPPAVHMDRAFEAADLGHPAFGWNLPNALTRYNLAKIAAEHPKITLIFGTGFKSILTRDTEALVTLENGHGWSCRLAIGADGRASPLREALNIDVDTTRYGQKALAFAVTHAFPHDNISTELYLSGGAFVLVPLPDHKGKPASSVVWMHDGPEALRLADLDVDSFSMAATERSMGVLGQLTLTTDRQVWPVVTQTAQALTARRAALVAEAAHVMPPIGAQGLNTSLMDIALLLKLAEDAPDTLGTQTYLDAFEKGRKHDVLARAKVIDLYNRICRSDEAPVQALRSLGLRLAHDVKPLRRGIMRAGLGAKI